HDTRRAVAESLPQRVELTVRELGGVEVADARAAGLEAQARPIAIADVTRLQPRLAVRFRAGRDASVLGQRVPGLDRKHRVPVRDHETRVVDLYRQRTQRTTSPSAGNDVIPGPACAGSGSGRRIPERRTRAAPAAIGAGARETSAQSRSGARSASS